MTAEQSVGRQVPPFFRSGVLLMMSMYHFFVTILEVIFIERRPLFLFRVTELRYKSFARLWATRGYLMSEDMPGNTFEMLAACKGVILDVGPGSGELLKRFSPNQITAMYGAEPAIDLHSGLRKRAKEAGFGSNFHPLLCGAEPESLIPALHKSGILQVSGKNGSAEDGVFDEICVTRVLCGVPHPQQTIKGLYSLLKPGGRMVVCEHIKNPWRTEGRLLARIFQIIYTLLGWSFFMGGCETQRDTLKYLKEAGEWDKFDLKYFGTQDVIPFIYGELIKKGGNLGGSYAEIAKK